MGRPQSTERSDPLARERRPLAAILGRRIEDAERSIAETDAALRQLARCTQTDDDARVWLTRARHGMASARDAIEALTSLSETRRPYAARSRAPRPVSPSQEAPTSPTAPTPPATESGRLP